MFSRKGPLPVWAYLVALYAFILVPIVRADRLYNDDLKRALFGRTGWDSNGRPLTTLLMKLLQCYDHALVDIAPFTQMAAAAVLVFTGHRLAHRFSRAPSWTSALLVFPLGAQPFFLENLSYHFDALSMALAVFFAVVPFIIDEPSRRANDITMEQSGVLAVVHAQVESWEHRRRWSFWLGTLSLFACLNLYQPAANVALVLALLEAVLAMLDATPPASLARSLGRRVAQVVLAAFSYEVTIGSHVNGWVRQKSVPVALDHLSQVTVNLHHFLGFILDSFHLQWWLYFGPVVAVMALVLIGVGLCYAWSFRRAWGARRTVLTASATCCMPFFAMITAFGPLLLLADPPVESRVFVGVGAVLAAGLLILDSAARQWRWSSRWSIAAATMLAIGMSVIASAYGNALAAQKAFEEHTARQLADDLAASGANSPFQSVLLAGSTGYAAQTAHIIEEFPLIRSLVPPYIDGTDSFHTHIFLLHFLPEFDDLRLSDREDLQATKTRLIDAACQAKPEHVRSTYWQYRVDATVVVLFGDARSRPCEVISHAMAR